MGVVFYSLAGRLCWGREKRTDVHIETQISKGGRDNFLTAVVTVLTHLGYENAWPPAFACSELLDQVLNPSRKIDPKYLTYIVETTAGKVHTGLLARKSDKEVVLRDAKNQETVIPADQVEELVAQRKSLMPELLLKDMTAQQVADLLAFLASLKTPQKTP